MSSPTIQLSFHQRLYRIKLPDVPNKYRQQSSSPSTNSVIAPKVLKEENAGVLGNLACEFLDKVQGNTRLLECIPQDEGAHCLVTEADVSDIARLNLVHAVNVVANELLKSKKNGRLECRRERSVLHASRPDMLWVWVDSKGVETNIAALEFKNTFILHYTDFKPAIANDNSVAAQKLKKLLKEHKESLLERNALSVSKQAKKYYLHANITDVAVFDWNEMVVFDFKDVSEINLQLVKFIWFSENNRTDGQCDARQTFRTVLLGFLLRALKRHGLLN